jgi:Tol biopolymer transport system component
MRDRRRRRSLASLWVVRPDGTGRHRIHLHTPGFAYGAGWSPDDTRIVFSLYTDDGRRGIYTARAHGSDVEPVATTTTGFFSNPDWGPARRRP